MAVKKRAGENEKKSRARISAKTTIISLSLLVSAMAVPGRGQAQTINCGGGTGAMSYGTISPCALSDTMVIAPGGGISSGGCLSYTGGKRGQCVISNPSAMPVRVVISGGPVTINSGGNTMPVDQFKISGTNGSSSFVTSANTFTISATPSSAPVAIPLNIGARLTVGANQTAGSYNGSITIDVTNP